MVAVADAMGVGDVGAMMMLLGETPVWYVCLFEDSSWFKWLGLK